MLLYSTTSEVVLILTACLYSSEGMDAWKIDLILDYIRDLGIYFKTQKTSEEYSVYNRL